MSARSENVAPPLAGLLEPPADPRLAPRSPHPTLETYYASADDRESFVTALFDGAARHYDRLCQVMSLGSGQWYRRQALERVGLRDGLHLLDLATGTGLVARSAARLLRDRSTVIGLDPSRGMLDEARRQRCRGLVQGRAEELPFPDERFDVVSMGYALRHMDDLEVVFAECLRVLRPGGRLLILEISRPRRAATRTLIRLYFRQILPLIMRIGTRNPSARTLMRYYWDTIDSCIPPEAVLEFLRRTGFAGVERRVFGGLLSEFIAVRPIGEPAPSSPSRPATNGHRVTYAS